MKEKEITYKLRRSIMAAGDAFIYKIPDPQLFDTPRGKVMSGKRPFDCIMAAGRRCWAIELKMMRRRKPWTAKEVKKKIADHQYEALRAWEMYGGVVARSVVAAYNEVDRKLWCYMMQNGEFIYTFTIGRQGDIFNVEEVRAHFFQPPPSVEFSKKDRALFAKHTKKAQRKKVVRKRRKAK